MRIALSVVSLLLAGTVAACGDEESAAPTPPASSEAQASVPEASTTPTEEPTPEPTYEILTRAAVEKALLTVGDLPPGYSQDPPGEDDGNKTFCDYTPPAEPKFRARRDFTKGGGMSAELLSIIVRQFKSTEEARAAWGAMVKTLETCKSEVYEGTTLTYSPMSAPKLGDDSAGLKIDADGVTLVQNFVLVGAAIISGGGGGLMNADVDTVASLLEDQINRYNNAALN